MDLQPRTIMKRILLLASLSGIVAVSLLIGCKKESQTGELKSARVSAEKNSFREVTSRLDAGGDFYLYLSTEQLLEGISGKISGWRQLFASMPKNSPEAREQIGKAFDLVTALVKDSGIEDVSGFGMSSIATETNFYHTITFLHHYPNRGTGFLWKMGGQQPHALAGLDMLPSNTALAIFSDLDVPLLWAEIRKEVGQSGIPQAQEFLDKLPDSFERATSLKWDKVLESLGGEFGLVLTLDDSKMIPVPLPTSERLEVPEPGLMIVAKVKDDTLFNRLDELLKKMNPQVIAVDKATMSSASVFPPGGDLEGVHHGQHVAIGAEDAAAVAAADSTSPDGGRQRGLFVYRHDGRNDSGSFGREKRTEAGTQIHRGIQASGEGCCGTREPIHVFEPAFRPDDPANPAAGAGNERQERSRPEADFPVPAATRPGGLRLLCQREHRRRLAVHRLCSRRGRFARRGRRPAW